ncbi:MAG TPA: AMIN domain-containing protein, partial [Candidatus Binatia bacterium]|nr:AMIN domain-containing protein [Candidatus Binatia bacterium]
MRKQWLSMFLTWLLLGLAAPAAEMPATAPAGQRSELQRVNVVRGADEIRVEINAQGSVTPKLSTADSPARVVVDLPATIMATGQSHIAVGSAGVKGVRIGMDGRTPPTTRVVVDLEQACRYELTPSADGKFVLTLHASDTAAANSTAKPVVASAPVETKPVSPFAPRVAEVVTPKPQPAAATVAAKSDAAPADANSKDFVFVEPTYAAKAATNPADEPVERAQEAAARFSDKTGAELLPVSLNAAQSTSSATSSTGITPAVNLAAEQKAQAGQQPASAG